MPGPPDWIAHALNDRYRLEREIGTGAMAVVYLAQDLRHHRSVAIKVLRPALAASVGSDRFLREIDILARLHHPHILPLFDSGQAGGALFYVMPYVEGESLRTRLKRDAQLPLDEAVRIAREVADALDYAHGQGVIHRDIKPENILLQAGHAIVADFGIARAVVAAGGERLTETGIALGTPAYMSPEQALGDRQVDARTDVYALGAVLFEMLAGEPPFTGPTAEIVLQQHVMAEPRPVTQLRPTVPAAISVALTRAMAKLPADRHENASAFAASLAIAIAPPATAGTVFHFARRRALLGAAIAVAAVAAVAVVWVRSRSRLPTVAATMAIAPFAPAVPDTALTRLGRELVVTLSATLDGVGGIRIADAMTVLSQTAARTSPLSRADALALARGLNASSFVHGTLLRDGPIVRLELGLYPADGGTSLAQVTVSGASDNITALTDSAALALLRETWRGGMAPTPSSAAVTTRSIPALRAFLDGERAIAASKFFEAADDFARSIKTDSTFWFAYWRLAYTKGWHGLPVDSAITAAYWTHRAEFPERDRLLIEAGDRNVPVSVRLDRLRAVTERFPDYWPAWLQYQDALVHDGPYVGTTYDRSRAALEHLTTLNPDLLTAWEHLFWIASCQRDSTGTGRALAELRRLGFGAGAGPNDLDQFTYYKSVDRLIRSHGVPDSSLSELGARLMSAYRGPSSPDMLASGYALYEFNAAQIDIDRRTLRHAPPPAVATAQWRSMASAWAARGAWDSAGVAANRFVQDAPPTDAATASVSAYGLFTIGAWLGAVDSQDVARWRGIVQRWAGGLGAEDRAEVAWLDGIAAVARHDRLGVRQARVALLAVDSARSIQQLARSLDGFALELDGQRAAAADSLAALEGDLAEHFGFLSVGLHHPFVSATNRLAAGRWFSQTGRAPEAARILTWFEAVLPGRYWQVERANRMVAGVAYFERARAEAALGRPASSRAFYQRFLNTYDLPVHGLAWMGDEARRAARAEAQR